METEGGGFAGGAPSGSRQQSGARIETGPGGSEPGTGDRIDPGWTGYEWMEPSGNAEGEEGEQAEETRRAEAASEPTAKERERHELENHAVYRNWCPICIGARGLGTQHRRQKKEDADKEKDGPRIFSDYYFMSTDEQSMPMLAVKFSRSKRLAATALPSKGVTEFAVNFLRASSSRLG